MKKLFLSISILAAVVGCNPKQETKQVAFEMPAVEDIAMYQVNPRVFAPENSLNAVAARIVSDYKAIAPEFGTIDDFKHLAQVCHEHGMGIILDWVANHTAWDHPWVKEHPDWYTRDEKTDTIICPQPWNWEDVADLNYDNKDMREAMIDAMKFWIVEVGIDGFRCDVADGVPADFWKDAIEQLRAAAGDRKIVMLAEGKNEDNFTVGGFDMNYGWDYKDEIVKVWKGAPASDLIKADSAEYANLPAGKVKLRFTTNHDHSTEATPCVEFTNERGAMAAYVASIFPHGGALIYGSQEVSYPEPINFFKYVAVDWTANSAIYQEYKELIELYDEHPALRKGKMRAWSDDDVLIFEKADAEESFLIIVNVRNESKAVRIPESWVGRETKDEVTDNDFKLESTLTLEPFQYLILK